MGKNDNLDRRLELSAKFLEMGQSLLNEGADRQDYCISQSGSFMILISGLIIDQDDVYDFAQLCSMFSAKKLLDSLGQNKDDLKEYLKNIDDESVEDILKRIKKLRDDENQPPIT